MLSPPDCNKKSTQSLSKANRSHKGERLSLESYWVLALAFPWLKSKLYVVNLVAVDFLSTLWQFFFNRRFRDWVLSLSRSTETHLTRPVSHVNTGTEKFSPIFRRAVEVRLCKPRTTPKRLENKGFSYFGETSEFVSTHPKKLLKTIVSGQNFCRSATIFRATADLLPLPIRAPP